MDFRTYYKSITGLKFDDKTHIHHVNRNREDNRIENLVHIDSLIHYRFHRNMDNILNIEGTLIINHWAIDELKNSKWMQGFCLPYRPNKDWIKRLLKSEKIILKNIIIRNKRCKIDDIPILITDNQRIIIDIYKNIK